MIYRGKFTCPYCKKTYEYISESRRFLSDPGLIPVFDVDNKTAVRVNINNIGNQTYLSGYCPCGAAISIPHRQNNEE